MDHLLNYFTEAEFRKIKLMDSMLEKTKLIVDRVFDGVEDKGGFPYTGHLYAVSEKGKTHLEKIVGLLHDIIEDTKITKYDLEEVNFSDEIIETILIVTRNKKKETYPRYITRIINSNNLTALNVKRYDMEHNMDLSRIPNPTEEDYKRNEEKYEPQYKRIINAIKERKSLC